MKKIIFVLIITGILVSCADNGKKEPAAGTPVLTEIASPAGDSCAEPYLLTDAGGIVHLSWIARHGKNSSLRFSSFMNEKWTDAAQIGAGENWFVNWADYPVIAADGKNAMVANFLQKSGSSTYAYDIKITSSADQGKTWSEPYILHDDGVKAEHGFVSLIPYNDRFFAAWLDGRNSPATEGHDHGHQGQMTIRGAILDKNGKKETEWELDNKVCDCCQTTVAITGNGPVVVYRDRSDQEIRDMAIVRYVNGQWTSPAIIHADNWKIDGCPVNGPRADALNNALAVAWFSATDKQAKVNVIFSTDGGATFGTPVRVDDGKPIGRVDVLLTDEKTAIATWMEGPSIKAAKVYADGRKDSSITVATSAESRMAGFPQMTRYGNKVMFAWTDSKAGQIKVAVLEL